MLAFNFFLDDLNDWRVFVCFRTQIVSIAIRLTEVEVAAVCAAEYFRCASSVLWQVFTFEDSLVDVKGLVDVAELDEGVGLKHTCLGDQNLRLDNVLSDVLHESAQG